MQLGYRPQNVQDMSGRADRSPAREIAAEPGEAAHKSYRLGTHRTVPPAETLARVQPHLRQMGITRVANITGLDVIGVPVVMVCRPNSRSIAVAQGKGLELEAAKASGIMEAVETYHAERITLPLRLCKYSELRCVDRVVSVGRLPFSVQGRYADDLPILWIEGRDLIGGALAWLPYEVVHTNYTLPLPQGSGCFSANTNGLGSGNHLLEAISHGICEVIERDAITLWKRQGDAHQRATVIDLETVDDPVCCELLKRLDRAGIDAKVWEASSDVGVATFYCLLVGRQPEFADPEFGSGCHPSRSIALSRALTEAVQARTTYIAGSRDDFLPDLYAPLERARRLRDCRALMTLHEPQRKFHDAPTFETDSISDDVDWMIQRLRSAGIEELLVVDLTNEELGLPVVRVVAPGLEGPDKGRRGDYVPGARAAALDEATS